MRYGRVDIVLNVEKILCRMLESGYSVKSNEGFVWDIGEWI